MLLQATSPVRLPGTLARAVRQFAENGKVDFGGPGRGPAWAFSANTTSTGQ